MPLTRRGALLLAAVVLHGATACSGERETSRTLPTRADSAPSGGEARGPSENLARSAFASGYAAGWRAGCDHAFQRALDNLTHDFELDFRVEDCYAFAPAELPTGLQLGADPHEAGVRLGMTDGCRAGSAAVSRYGVLVWSQFESLTESTCR